MTFISHYEQVIIVNNYNATRLQLKIRKLKSQSLGKIYKTKQHVTLN
jgi:hypothetical protein